MSEPATAPAPAGVLGQRQAMARRGGWLPWSSVRNLIIFGFALLALALAFVTIAGAYQTTRHRAELEQLEFHSTRASLIQNVETQASIAGLLLQRYVEASGDTYPAEINQHAAAAQVSLEQVLNMGNAPPRASQTSPAPDSNSCVMRHGRQSCGGLAILISHAKYLRKSFRFFEGTGSRSRI